MHRIEVNVQTGERKVIELTPDEVAQMEALAAAAAAQPIARSPLELVLDYIASRPDAPQEIKDEVARRKA